MYYTKKQVDQKKYKPHQYSFEKPSITMLANIIDESTKELQVDNAIQNPAEQIWPFVRKLISDESGEENPDYFDD